VDKEHFQSAGTKPFLIGGTGFAAEVAEALAAQLPGGMEGIAGVYDEDTRLRGNPLFGLTYLGTLGDLLDSPPPSGHYVLALSENQEREQFALELERLGLRPLTVRHPLASVSPAATVEDGAYVAAFAFIGPRAFVGKHTVLNVAASVGYAARLETCVQLSPGVRISRYCQVAAGAFFGSNAVVAPGVSVGKGARIGAGSFVYQNVPAGKFVLGVPAKLVD
jgi:sugar O-acyltransferase (sialic acid O-acetyltransferase NeuD family)